jgi:Cu+-exporting ATPase
VAAQLVKDPICGMMIDPVTAAGKSDYSGQTYYFCAATCKQTFDADPAKHASPRGQPAAAAGARRWWEFWK